MTRQPITTLIVAASLIAGVFALGCEDTNKTGGGNNGANNGTNNGGNNGTNNGNNGTNNGNNGTNNGTTNNGTNNGTTNNGTNNGNNGDDIAQCQAACGRVTACQEFLDACGPDVATQANAGCADACATNPDARAQILAVGNLPCATVVPLAIDGFDLGEVCGGGNNGGPTLCDAYCDLALANCSGDNLLYATAEECQTACADLATDGTDGDTSGDTIQCRIYHLGVAATDAATHCPHGGPDGAGVCVDPDLCANVTCDGDQTCNPDTGMCEGGGSCTADANEPNDDAEAATALATMDQTQTGLTICAEDDDWFEVTIPTDRAMLFEVTFDGDVVDIDLEVYDAGTGDFLGESVTTGDREWLFTDVGNEGTYRIRVFSFGTTDVGTYDLSVRFAAAGTFCEQNDHCLEGQVCGLDNLCADPPMCTPDAFEPNDDRTMPAALTVPLADTSATLCTGDADWYSFTLPAGQDARVDLAFTHAIADIDMLVYIGDATEDLDFSNSTDDAEYVVVPSTDAERTVVFLVYGFDEPPNAYTMSVSIGDLGVCLEDADCDAMQTCNIFDRVCQ